MNLKEKQLKVNLISQLIMEGKAGILDNSKYLTLNMQDVNFIKKTLFEKSKSSKGYEKEFFYKTSISMNVNNYKNILKTLENHFRKFKNVDVKKDIDYDSIEDCESRTSKPIIVNSLYLQTKLKNDLKNYVYLLDSTLGLVRIYFRNKHEYVASAQHIKEINKSLGNFNLTIKVHFLSESKMIHNMSKLEKREFDSFIDTY